MYKIDAVNGKHAVLGGSFLGGGGGGSEQNGMETLEEALKYGEIVVWSIHDFAPDDHIVTASAVGSPASKEGYISVKQVVDNLALFKSIFGKEIKGIITNENGGHSTTNGWILSAVSGIPLVDAPCNGRAHPTGVMGSMGLEFVENYITLQTAAGGKGDQAIHTYVRGKLDHASKIVRQAAVEAGGLVTVLRNPIDAAYVKSHAAIDSLAMAIEIGKILDESEDSQEATNSLSEKYNLSVVAKGVVSECHLTIEGGFDHGYIVVESAGESFKVTFWNEFMTIDKGDKRLATFPDLIGLMDDRNKKVLTSATVKEGDRVYLYKMQQQNLILGAGMENRQQIRLVEKILNTKIEKYIFEE
jgi:hypothetical protein